MEYKIYDNKIKLFDNDKLVGYVDFIKKDDVYDIINTFVDDSYRGLGIGKKLVEFTINELKSRNCRIITSCSFASKFNKVD